VTGVEATPDVPGRSGGCGREGGEELLCAPSENGVLVDDSGFGPGTYDPGVAVGEDGESA
jgi:hypothetical protein